MKQYSRNSDGGYRVDGADVPECEGNTEYLRMLKEVEEGEAEIIAYDGAADEAAKTIADYKASRELAVSQIEVTVDGMVFDGDEIAQGRMVRAILAMQAGESTLWKLKDNTVVSVTKVQLKEALKVAGMIQTELWFE